MRMWYVRCYGGPLDLKRMRVSDPRPPHLMVPKPVKLATVTSGGHDLDISAPEPETGRYTLGLRRTLVFWPQMFEHSREIAYIWEGWR